MSHCKHLHSGEGPEPMREPGNRGITGQQPLGNNQSFHYSALKGPKSALKYSIVRQHFQRETDATESMLLNAAGRNTLPVLVSRGVRINLKINAAETTSHCSPSVVSTTCELQNLRLSKHEHNQARTSLPRQLSSIRNRFLKRRQPSRSA